MGSAYEKILQMLEKNKISYKIHAHEDIATVEVAENKLNIDLDSCFKTLAFDYQGKLIFVALLAKEKLKYAKLCKNLKLKRSSLKKADSQRLEVGYGYQAGGLSPIPIFSEITFLLDASIKELDVIFCGSGRRDRTIEIKVTDLLQLAKFQIYDLRE